jgi:hypothetical protein
MKPLDEKAHQYIADWVKNGGVLLYCSSDTDPFQNVFGMVEPKWQYI